MYDVEAFKKAYPEWFDAPTAVDIVFGVFIFSLLFLIPYLYIRFLERGFVSFAEDKLIPFIRFRLHLEKLIILIDRFLKIQIFKTPKARF
ncbi:Uncharacterised protein [uncultured archaeon]|nr:Uncharacterised protein [uncultured archaeon]